MLFATSAAVPVLIASSPPSTATVSASGACELAGWPGRSGSSLAGLIRAALSEQTNDPVAAARPWARIDRRLADESAVVPLYNPEEIDFVSARVGNFRSNPQLGPLLDQLWVR